MRISDWSSDVCSSDLKRPAIVHIVDQRVVHPVPDQLAYSLSKSALWQATATLAVAFGGRARVNAVAPGLTMATDDYSAAQVERMAKLMPLGVLPTPAKIADAVDRTSTRLNSRHQCAFSKPSLDCKNNRS